ncbi:FAD-dependent oxidoreductase [Cellulomonas sp. JH27-2]|uniref:FAD-dependent oxidoreductase n=1 Tax=Cellulomonas sp. JH27-2 TaxID=2774139 RepID=UPI00177C46DA|nr:FAD-dependent oxidoreductase [Cellulomonas sp. JH27-2]MBD8059219.1 FAD-dependent oxidoreductase [Cellulomonas sp. JH27-2]
MHVDHVVVGGGVVGSAAAWRLAARGRDVLLLERFGPGHAHGASHGSARIYRNTYAADDYLDLAQEALGLWRGLEAETGASLLTVTGAVSHGAGRGDLEDITAAFDRRGIPYAWLTAQEADERWPGMRFEGRVLHEPVTAGRLDADASVAALQAAAVARGAVVRHDTEVLAVRERSNGVVVETSHGTVHAGSVVVAAGAWTSRLLSPQILLPALVVTQEQPAHFALRPGVGADWPAFTHQPAEPHPWPSGTYGLVAPEGVKVGFHAVGPVTDPDRRTYQPEPGQLAALRRYVEQWLPGADADRLEPVSCTYTCTPTHDFVLDRVGRVVVAAGFSGHGFKFAPAVGRLLADLATDDDVRTSRRFALRRRAGVPA